MRSVLTIALVEARQLLRSRWLLVYSFSLAALGAAISWIGLVMMKSAGFTGFERTAASLIGLMLYLVPLAAMLTAVPAFTDGQGLYRQLLCEPVSRLQLVTAKVLGLALGNSAAVLLGFALCSLVVVWQAGWRGLAVIAEITVLAIITTVVYVALAALLTIAARRGVRAYIAVLALLFVSTVLFDIIMLGLGLVLPVGLANRAAFIGLFINPADAIRVAGMLVVGGKESLGVAAVLLSRSLGGQTQVITLLLATLAAWTVLPVWLAGWLLKRQDA